MIISLLGYMGSGKSHVATILSEKTGLPLVDLDREISSAMKMPVSEIFSKYGEIAFRKKEKETLEELLATRDNAVLSLGGGTPAYYNNAEHISNGSISIYLRTGVSELAKRLAPQKSKRPLIANIPDEDLPEFIAKHLFERRDYYGKARFTVDTDNKNPEAVADQIIDLLKRHHY